MHAGPLGVKQLPIHRLNNNFKTITVEKDFFTKGYLKSFVPPKSIVIVVYFTLKLNKH